MKWPLEIGQAYDSSEFVWQYDAYGNLTNDGTSTYVYDAANRLSSVTNAAGTTTYAYNGDGDRVSQTVNGTLATYVLDTATSLTMVLAETNTSNGQTIRYLHGLDLVAQSDGTQTAYFAYDGLGSVRQLTDATGTVQLAQTFDPYGNGYSKTGSAVISFGYTGEQTDSNGFVYLRARYYNSSQGRFMQRDTWRGSNRKPQSEPLRLCRRQLYQLYRSERPDTRCARPARRNDNSCHDRERLLAVDKDCWSC